MPRYDLEIPGYAANVFSVRYGYDGAGLFSCVTSSYASVTNVFRYTRLPGTAAVAGYTASDLAGNFTFRSTRTYEPNRNLIASVSNIWGAAAVSSFAYTNDALGRRTRRVDTAQGLPVTNVFAYNHRSEVTNAAMGASTSSYRYDDIGNRKQATADAALTVYAANALNQYASVTAAGQDVPVAYDADGNMLTNGVWVYAWDAENRMVSTVSDGATIVSNAYDYLNRRVRKEVYAWDSQSTAYSLQSTASYVWDGWNIAAEIAVDSVAGSTNVHFYTWGLDLNGTLQGSGGVGGLLADTRVSSDTSYLSPLTYYPTYDANGNVTDYVDASGNLRARYAYSAFGEITSQSGDMAGAFTHRFSTKPFDAETGVSKYQLRDYLPGLGRWATRDPIEESGGLHLYGFVGNNTVSSFDPLGLDQISICTANHQSEKYAVYWIVVDENQVSTREIKVGTVDSSYQNVTLNSEFGNRQFNFWDLARVAGDINDRFGFLNSYEERVQKGAIKLAVKHPKTPSSYSSLDEAGTWGSWLARGKSHGNGWEFAGWIFGKEGVFTLGSLVTSHSGETVRLWVRAPIGENANIAGWFHNHPSGGEGTSGADQATQRMVEELTRNDDSPNVYSLFGYALSPKGIVVKTGGVGNDITVYP